MNLLERFTELAPISGALCERRQDVNRLLNLDSSWGIAVVRMIMGFVLIITGYEKLISGIQKVSAAMLRNRIPFPTAMAAYITGDRKSTRLNSSHTMTSRMPSSA